MSANDISNETILNLAAQFDRGETTKFIADAFRALLADREALRGQRDSARMTTEDVSLDLRQQVAILKIKLDWAREERDRLREALERAIEYVDLWSCYAVSVYQEKHDLEGNLRDLRGVLEATKR